MFAVALAGVAGEEKGDDGGGDESDLILSIPTVTMEMFCHLSEWQ